MGQEFFINSQALEDKIRQLLPSQGGAGASFDLSASTQIIPIIDVTESAEGSDLRQDLQSSLSHGSISAFDVRNTTTTLVNNTGYWRVFGGMATISAVGSDIEIFLSDGTTNKIIKTGNLSFPNTAAGVNPVIDFDFIVFLAAGETLQAKSGSVNLPITGCTRQIADIDGNLTNP